MSEIVNEVVPENQTASNTPVELGNGVQTLGERTYSSIERKKVPILEKILKTVMSSEDGETKIEDIDVKYLDYYLAEYAVFLKKKAMYFPYKASGGEKRPEINRDSKGKNNQEEVTKYETMFNNFRSELSKFDFDTEKCIPLKNLGFKYQIHYYLFMNMWAIIVYRGLKDGKVMNMKNLLNCVISYSRSLKDLEESGLYGENFREAYLYIFGKLLGEINKVYNSSSSNDERLIGDEIYQNIFKNPDIIMESFWDLGKPKSFVPYEEQMEILRRVMFSLINNTPQILFYKVPPGGGKTMWAVVLAAKIAKYYKDRIDAREMSGRDHLMNICQKPQYWEFREKSIKTYEKMKKEIHGFVVPDFNQEVNRVTVDETKYLLYICYNDIVRSEVASLCNAEGVDVPFWLAISEHFGSIVDTLLRPFKGCYSNWKRAKKEREDPMRFGPLDVQWAYFQDATMCRPAIIISDLQSALNLLRTFPNRFIPYFDETFAGADSDVVIELISKLPKTSVLLSATLPEMENIPTIVNYLRNKHNVDDESQISMIKSNRLHISCTIVGAEGNIYMPHNFVENLVDFGTYVRNIENDPLKMRCYSPQIVYLMVSHIRDYLPEELLFHRRFENYGDITHEDIRQYSIEILDYVANSGNEELFERLKGFHPQKMTNLDKNSMLTTAAHYYQTGNSLFVTANKHFKQTFEDITQPILERTPKLSPIISRYLQEIENNENMIQQILDNPTKHISKKGNTKITKNDIDAKIKELQNRSITLKWAPDLIPNSVEHGELYRAPKLFNPSYVFDIDVKRLRDMPEDTAKLLLSRIGKYDPREMSKIEKEVFLEYRNDFTNIFATKEIEYGTNLSITNVIIDELYIGTRNSIYQLMGRAGRRGKKSFNAMVQFRNNSHLELVMRGTYDDVEARVAEQNFIEFLRN